MSYACESDCLNALAFIGSYIDELGYPPSQVELCRWMGYRGLRAGQYRLEHLESHGWITRTPGVARGLRMTEAGRFVLNTREVFV